MKHTSLTIIPPRLCATNIIGIYDMLVEKPRHKLRVRTCLVFNLPVKLHGEVSAVLRYAVLIAGFEQAADDVCIISICPYFGSRFVLEEVIPWPKHLIGVFVGIFVSTCRFRWFRTKEFLERFRFTRCRIFFCVLPCRLRVTP